MALIFPARHIDWSTDRIDLEDPFQRRWHMRQVILHGRSEDIRDLNLEEVRQELDGLDLPPDLYQVSESILEHEIRVQIGTFSSMRHHAGLPGIV